MVFERVREIICDQLDLDEDRVTMDSNLLEDFDADSLDIVDLSMTLEDEFGLEMPDDVAEYIANRLKKSKIFTPSATLCATSKKTPEFPVCF